MSQAVGQEQAVDDPRASAHRDAGEVLRVRNGTNPKDVAAAIYHAVMEDEDGIVVRAIGAGAVNTAVKALIIARVQIANTGRDMLFSSGFESVVGTSGDVVNAIIFRPVLR